MTSRLGYDVAGPDDAPVLVLGSSLGTTRAMWDDALPRLAEDLRVVRYDHLGHGLSAVPPGPYRVDDLAAEVVALLDDLHVERAHLGGLSLGGVVAMQVAAGWPHRVDRLGLVCTAAHLPPAQAWLDRADAVRAGGTGAVADAVVERWFTPSFARSARARQLGDELRQVDPEGYAGCCEAIAAADLRDALAGVTAPTLVVAGADDPATPPAWGRQVVDLLAGPARFALVDDAAHLAGVEQHDRVADLLLAHFGGED